jgi:hypothetical protein
MLRSSAMFTLSLSVLAFGCSSGNGGHSGNGGGGGSPVVIPPDMAVGTGGGGGTAGGGGSAGGNADMATTASTDMAKTPPDLAGLPPADHDPTQHAPELTMGTTFKQSTITAPNIWTVVWKGDAATTGAKVQSFMTWMLTSDYWIKGNADYAVGAGTPGTNVIELTTAPPATITDAALASLIDKNVGVTAGWPAKSANLIISFVLNPNTTVTNGGASGCVDFDGYHYLSTTQRIPYLVNAYCMDTTTNMPDWDNLTVTISHEASEAAVDYNLQKNRVEISNGQPYLGGGELGDMCLSLNAGITAPSGAVYQVQRLYSNNVAIANVADPCLPSDGKAYFGASFYGDTGAGADVNTITVKRDSSGNGQATFNIEPFAYDSTVGPVRFYIYGPVVPAGVTFSPDVSRRPDPSNPNNILGAAIWGNPGSTTPITIKVDSTYVPDAQSPRIELLIVAQTQDGRFNVWWANANAQ